MFINRCGIPKIIHYVWLGGKPLPDKFRNYIDGWKSLMPEYEFMEWNEDNFDLSVCKFAEEAYSRQKYAFSADFIRIAVLKRYGGIYLDTDVEVLKPFDGLLENEFFLGFENEAHVGSAVIGSVPDHPLVTALYAFYISTSFVNGKTLNMTPNVIYLTYLLRANYGLKPTPVTQRLTDGESSSVTVYAPEYFTPFNFNTRKENITENSYAVHRFANSWSPKSLQSTQKFVNSVRKIVGKRIFALLVRLYANAECRKAGKRISSAKRNESRLVSI